jgi:hypothetical protein
LEEPPSELRLRPRDAAEAERIAAALADLSVRIDGNDVLVTVDREFNDLLLRVIRTTEAALVAGGIEGVQLDVAAHAFWISARRVD